ncbi:alpha/beta hydrolase [Lactococcus termiticola]|uniref:Alpha/beta hydrolase n=1 Tax=Lactococcus termiticola TaxID=2169526 RepID=A0A2R5HKK7_9LACT|nr:alpha/beta hydrolase [Lactococcus termiticola]GBG97121.1 alpha/beta hydrolase [Lactococcus termiticola]
MKKTVKISLSIATGLALLAGGFASGIAYSNATHEPPAEKSGGKLTIYPTIYITGSDGQISSIDPMITEILKDKTVHAERGLEIVVNKDNSLKVSGKLDKRSHNPIIEVGMEKGTNNSTKYEEALHAVMSYLAGKYDVPYVNVMGYSAGGSGVYHYLIDYSFDRSLPPVKKFLSLDGQYNASTAQPDQDYKEVLQTGAKIQSKYYKFWLDNYQKLSPDIQVSFLAGNYNTKEETDGVVPWADTFSVYWLLQKNGNPVSYHIFDGPYSDHAHVAQNEKAINYAKVFFYQ